MNIWVSLLISLLLTTIVGFATPIIVCGLILSLLAIASHLPEIAVFGQSCYEQVWCFLSMFGNGSGREGIVTIALTCGFVGFLFESLNFYRYQTLISQPVVNNQIESK
jgi:hypothetical protein